VLHYAFYYRLDATVAILIWHTDDVGSSPDRFETLDPYFVDCFPDRITLLRFAETNIMGTIVDDDPVVVDLDAALEWAMNPVSTTEHCRNALGVWNLFIDLCATLPDKLGTLKTDIDNALEIEQKLFYGSNLPSITPEGEYYKPHWETEDKTILRLVFANGTEALRQSVKRQTMA
jgi:hypothetical protein